MSKNKHRKTIIPKAKNYSRKKELLKKIVLFISSTITFIVLTFGIPILINEAYKTNSGYLTLWNASDVLAFYAVILSGIITIASLIVTIYFSKRDTEKQIKHAQAQTNVPFFIIEQICSSNDDNRICKTNNNDDYLWKKRFYISQLESDEKIVSLTLKNIGNGIAITPICDLDILSIDNNIIKYIEKDNDFNYKYNLYSVLKNKFGPSLLPQGSLSFATKVTIRYKNTLGIDFMQYITIQHDINVESNTVLLTVNDMSHQTVEL